MKLLAIVCIVLVFVEIWSLVYGPGKSFVEGINFRQASHTRCDTPFLFGNVIAISNFLFILRGGDGGDGLGST